MYILSRGILHIFALLSKFWYFAYSGNTLKVSIFCIFWQFFESFNILHYLAVFWNCQYFAYSGSALKASTIWVQKNPSVARDLCPCEINFHILAAAHLLFFSCILLYKSLSCLSLKKSFLRNSTTLYILLAAVANICLLCILWGAKRSKAVCLRWKNLSDQNMLFFAERSTIRRASRTHCRAEQGCLL